MPISRYAMNYGLALGLYWVMVFSLRILSSIYPGVSLAYIITLLGSVYVAFRLGRMFLCDRQANGVPSTYLHFVAFGMLLFFYGSLLDAIVQYGYYRYIDPTYIGNQFHTGIEALKTLPQSNQFINAYQQLGTPSAIQLSMQIVWNAVMCGSVLFAIMGVFMVKRQQPEKKQGGEEA